MNWSNKRLSFLVAVVILFAPLFLFSVLSTPVFATTYLQAFAKGVVQPSQNIAIDGQIVNTSASDTIENVNVSASVTSGGSGYDLSSATGSYAFNITAPSAVGVYNVSIQTNESTPHEKTIPIYVSNVSRAFITFTGNLPPYSAGNKFSINLTLRNGSAVVVSYIPDVEIFAANGQKVSWTITNTSPTTDSLGAIGYNITIASEADPGQYAIIVEKGLVAGIVGVQSGYKVIVNPQTNQGEITLNFAPASTVMLLTKIKTTGDVAVASAASSVKAYIILPNGTTRTLTLQAMDQTSYPGYYNNNFTETSASGTYDVRVDAVISSTTVQGYTFFDVRLFNARLEPEQDFFKEWGGSAAFGSGQTVGLNIIATNLTDDSIFTVPGDILACNGTYLQLVDVFFPNGTSVSGTVDFAEFTTGNYFMDQICRIKFNMTTNKSSPYGIKVNVTVGGVTETAKGYFLIQKYFLKPTVVAGFGGEMEMKDMVAPGSNITITLSAYNITNGTSISGASITNAVVKKIKPIEFDLGIEEMGKDDIQYAFSSGSTPTIYLYVPEEILGPVVVDIEATIGGETVRGNAFFISNYLSGFLGPKSKGGPGAGGPGEEGGEPFCSCTGLQTFAGAVMEVETGQSVTAGAVTIHGIIEAREEFTDKDVSDYITFNAGGSSDSNGLITANVSFDSGYSFSGFYFILFNASFHGKSSGLPSGFMCKNLKFWPRIYSVGGSDTTWRIAPESGVNIVITNISRANDSSLIRNASARIPIVFNFNPSKGGERILTPNNSFDSWIATNWSNWTINPGQPFNVTSNLINFTIYPQNFTLDGSTPLSKWPNGFVDIQPTICTESLGGDPNVSSSWLCDGGFAGFQVVPFDAWVEDFQWGSTTAVNTSESYVVRVKSNVSLSCTGKLCDRVANSVFTDTNNTGFTVKLGRPWEGMLTTLTDVTVEFLEDNWNSSSDTFGEEKWRVNYTIPATTKKGEAMMLITVNNSYGETTEVELWTTFTKYNIIIPYEEGIDLRNMENNTNVTWFWERTGWNLTEVSSALGLSPKSEWSCYWDNITVQRWGEGGSSNTIVYNNSVKLLVLDNETANVYDHVVFNTNDGILGYANENNRTLSYNAYGIDGIYVRKIEHCHFVKVINSTATTQDDINDYGPMPSWGGEGEVGKLHVVPYIVKLSNIPVSNAEVHVNGMIQQNDEGFGFESKLEGGYNENGITETGKNYSYMTGNTDSSGVAFVKVNVTDSGRFNLFWKVNTSQDYDIATFNSGTQVELRKFKGWGQPVYPMSQGKIILVHSNNTPGSVDGGPIWYAFGTPAENVSYVYNASVVETGNYGFIRDTEQSTWYMVHNATSNITCLDDDANFTYANPNDPVRPDNDSYPVFCLYMNESSNNLNTSFGAEDNTRIAIGSYASNSTPQGSMTFIFFQEEPRPSDLTASQNNPNVTVMLCAETFDSPQSRPIEGANIKAFAMNFDVQGPPERTWLTMYDPLNGTAYVGGGSEPESGIFTGPKGCVVFTMAHPSNWPANKCTEVQSKVIRGSDAEMLWVGRVCT